MEGKKLPDRVPALPPLGGIVGVKPEKVVDVQVVDGNVLRVDADCKIANVALYDGAGVLLSKVRCDGEFSASLQLPLNGNLFVVRIQFADGTIAVRKCR